MKYKILCSDIDGTLLSRDRQLSRRTIKALKKIKDDVLIVLASSRMPSAMTHLQEQIGIVGNPLICYNGGLVIGFNGKIEYSLGIPLSVLQLLNDREDFKYCNISTYSDDNWHTQYFDHWTEREEHNTKVAARLSKLEHVIERFKTEGIAPQKIMCMGDGGRINSIIKALEGRHKSDLNFYRSKETYLELSHKDVNKAKALKTFIENELKDCTMADVISFGDNYNDIELLKQSGYSVAVENAKMELKSIASFITKANIEDGVALAIEDVFGFKEPK